MRARVLYHGNCFDGAASAAVFSRFLEAREGKGVVFEYTSMAHAQGDPFAGAPFDGDVNACVDFRFSPRPALTWWFDHHASAFPTPADQAAFEKDTTGRKFWDPHAPSCTGLIARLGREKLGFTAPDLAPLVEWADLIDAAKFPTAAMAVRLAEPALKVMTLLEATKDPAIPLRVIETFRRGGLASLADEPWVKEPLAPILDRHFESIEVIRRRAVDDAGVIFVDLVGSGVEGANKFIAYDLFPEGRYTVVLSQDARKAKISVGVNPWSKVPRKHDISKICEKYGGGGHPVVGAVSLPPDRLEDARRFAREIVATLKA